MFALLAVIPVSLTGCVCQEPRALALGFHDAKGKPKPKQNCPPKSNAQPQQPKKKMRGEGGQQITSRTLRDGVKVGQYTYRLDVENPAPGKRPGSLHVQLGGKGSKHYEYDEDKRKFIGRDGEELPAKVQDAIDKDPKTQAQIQYALKSLLGGG
ncbi:hypothetical protein [Allokutzneria oryzae]|uniref:Lipoprotein n=1 Tax=Allokutzneria oryzae TaxID=1378989 RepID=A0ABV5ZPQ6_9PSEU